jgi:hypothetical protein
MINKIIDGTPTPANLRADFPNTSFPANLSPTVLPEGYVWVTPTTPPECGPFERVEQAAPDQVDGAWLQQWQIVSWEPEEIQQHLVNAIQQHLDDTARSRAYDGILSLCTYATSPSPRFAAEGQAGVEWRDACWTHGYEILGECQAGTRAVPTLEELIAELPAMVWPG